MTFIINQIAFCFLANPFLIFIKVKTNYSIKLCKSSKGIIMEVKLTKQKASSQQIELRQATRLRAIDRERQQATPDQ